MALGNDVTLKVGFDIDKFNAELRRTNGMLSSWASSVKGIFGGLAIGHTLLGVGKDMIEVTSQFQKFEAVLTNTLGSNSAAQKALREIKQFSIETPFEVAEITAAYVRWANMGLDPTIEKMRKVGDVATALGAGFEQTAEAFKDLMVGQTKRLEEVGIAAEAIRGTNLLKLAFKGVTIEIEKNASGVQKALDVYSQLNGVLGTMDSVSGTLGTKISNLSDAWTNFLDSMGKQTGGPIAGVVSFFTDFLNALSSNNLVLTQYGFIAKTASDATADFSEHHQKLVNSMADEAIKSYGFDLEKIAAIYANPLFTKDVLAEVTKRHNEEIKKQTKAVDDAALSWKNYWEKRQSPLDTKYVAGGKLHDSSEVGSQMGNAWSGPESANMPGQVGAPFNIEEYIKIKDSYKIVTDDITGQNEMMAESFRMMAESAIVSFADAFGGGEDLGKAFLKSLARLGAQFGSFLITMGLATMQVPGGQAKGLRQIAAGTALVVGSAALGAVASSMGGAGSGGGGGIGNIGEGRSVVNSNSQNSAGAYNVTFRVRGSDLIGAMESARYDNQIRRGG